ncbi:MAG: hypothetical protein HC857_01105 [Synechococcales cyanobacterium RU_4_20]|nr:hypothetical protein [Synechococcales cyanobacterium RU_4_20]NJR71329.1 hypothetical protein [Synechococcales cyanobacterium CRU_2_2]
MNEQIARMGSKWAGLVGGLVVAIAAAPYMVTATQTNAAARQTSQAFSQQKNEMEQREQQRQELAPIAKARIDAGCTPMLLNGEQVLVRPGMRGRDPTTGLPMAPGIVVCDRLGNTAITDAEGYFTDFAALSGAPQNEPQTETQTEGQTL